MSAFEITITDLEASLKRLKIQLTEIDTEELFSSLYFDEIESAALSETCFNKQVSAAFKELDRQVLETTKNPLLN